MKLKLLQSRLGWLTAFFVVALLGTTAQLHAQGAYHYYHHAEKSIGKLKHIIGGQVSSYSDPSGMICEDVIRFKINDNENSSLVYQMGGKLDLSEDQKVSVQIYLASPAALLTNKTLACALKSDGNPDAQAILTKEISMYDQWVQYTFDFADAPKDVAFNELYFYFIYNDTEKVGDGLQFYIDDIKGPKITPNQIVTKASTDQEGNSVIIDFINHEGIKSIINPSFVIREKTEQAAVIPTKSVLVTNDQIQLVLSRKLKAGEEVTLAYESGEVTDNAGNKLAVFEGLDVVNNSTQMELTLYPYYNFGEASLTTINGSNRYTINENYKYEDEIVGQLVRGGEEWVDISWKLPEGFAFDFTTTKSFSIDVMIENTGQENANREIAIGVGSKLSTAQVVNCYGQWKRYYFDLSNIADEDLVGNQSVKFYLAPADNKKKAEGLTYYIDNIMGPKLQHTAIITSAALNENGKEITLDLLTHASIKTVDNAVFVVKANGTEIQGVQFENNEKGFVFKLPNALTSEDDVTISFTGGTVEDTDGITLATFEDKAVENNMGEVPAKEYPLVTYHNFDETDAAPLSYERFASVEIVDNPDNTGVVSNAKVTKLTKGDLNDTYIKHRFDEVHMSEAKAFKFYFYHPTGEIEANQHVLSLRFRGPNNSFASVDKTIKAEDGWQDLVFDFTDVQASMNNESGDNVKVSIDQVSFNYMELVLLGNNAGGNTYYLSNLRGPEAKAKDDASLNAIFVDGQLIDGFEKGKTAYTVSFPYGSTAVPTVSVQTSHPNAVAEITPAANLTETTKIVVTAADGNTTGDEIVISFQESPASTNADLAWLKVDEIPLFNFDANSQNYELKYLYGTTRKPVINAEAMDEQAKNVEITLPDALPGNATITVTAQDESTKVYTLALLWSQGSNNTDLASLKIEEDLIEGFEEAKATYQIELPYGTEKAPVVTAMAKDPLARNTVVANGIDGQGTAPVATTITVTPQDGADKVYTINWVWPAPSDDATLSALYLGEGESKVMINGFAPDIFTYDYELPFGTTDAPIISATKSHDGAVVTLTQINTLEGTATAKVTAQNGTSENTYSINFTVAEELSPDASIASVTVDGEAFAYEAGTENYTVDLPHTATSVPAIVVTATSTAAKVVYSDISSLDETLVVTVTSQDEQNTTVARFSFNILPPPSSDATLKSITVGGEALASFEAETLNYTYVLEPGVEAPTVTAEKNDAQATIEVTQADAPTGSATIKVTAADGTVQTYTVTFSVRTLSSDATLSAIYLDGEALSTFDAGTLSYAYSLGSEAIVPTVTADKSDAQATIEITQADSPTGSATIKVTAEDGTVQTYTVTFSEQPLSSVATLSAIYFDGVLIENFEISKTDYTFELSEIPEVTVETEDAKATVVIDVAEALGELTIITVTAEDGVTKKTYTILMKESQPLSSENQLASKVKVFSGSYQTLTIISQVDLEGSVLIVSDLKGAVIVQQSITSAETKVSGLKAGIYIVQIVSPKGRLTKKVKI
ncbi:T9SS type A sorting domain-containing protein [Flammeovirga aprica]|uniref:T9SS type A sorting domain-containing protein n=1 Tax=Flammeovirga aprica JL-4 TaxID=694437 RepID=A0A7X9XAX4_9BACT|nr:T9SS type A sorting domain-containing protein [Flammeovirga aprica]NME70135.1 T9SS type A sorting domain-containing protein [Flammeovirga aprica JL-4]